MLKSTDLIRLPYPPDLIQAGIAITSRKLAAGSFPEENIDTSLLYLEVARTSATLAFLRYLLDRKIHFQYQKFRPFSQPEHGTVVLGGRKCEILTSLITDRDTARQLSRSAARILETSVRVPAELPASSLHSAGDLAVFAFAAASNTGNRKGLQDAAEAGEPFLCHHVMPEAWRQSRRRKALGSLLLRYAGDSGITLDLYGLSLQQEPCVERVTAYPQTWVATRCAYSSVSCLHAGSIPSDRIEMKSAGRHSAYSILPLQWRNLWVYGEEIILAGYLSFEEIWEMTRAAPVKLLGPTPDLEAPAASLHALPRYLESVAQQQIRG